MNCINYTYKRVQSSGTPKDARTHFSLEAMIWVFIPAYNEEHAIEDLLRNIHELLENKPHQILVVDDGSRDETPNILKRLTQELPLTVMTHTTNRGLGETERDGFEYIAWTAEPDDLLVRVEGDGTHGTTYIESLIAKLEEGYDVVNTSRFQEGGKQMGVNAYRSFISRCANLFMKVLFGIEGMKDYSCGFRAYRVGVLRQAFQLMGSEFLQLRGLGFTSTLEIVVKLSLVGCRFAEVPFVLRYDMKQGPSKMVSSITTLGYLTMAVMHHWPFGGWRQRYREIGKAFRFDRQKAMRHFAKPESKPLNGSTLTCVE